ncbi:MAG: pre-toxin TG domain-containing protein [bacterium]
MKEIRIIPPSCGSLARGASMLKQIVNLARKAKDNLGIYPSQETITSPGALRFENIEVIPSINLSSSELAKIPDLILAQSLPPESTPSLDPSLVSPPWYEPYQEGSGVKGQGSEDALSLEGKFIKSNDYVFYVMNGRKRLVPKESLNAYLPKEKQAEIENVSSERLAKLPTGDVLPEIKYPDGSLIKIVEYYSNVPSLIKREDYFLIFSGTKHLIDSGTMQIFSLKPNDAKSISDSEFLSIPTSDPLRARVVRNESLGDFLILGLERRFIPTLDTTNFYLNLLGQRSVEQISTEELQTYVPKDALEKIEPPPPPPQPKKKKWYQKVWSAVSGIVSTVVRGLPGIGQIYTFACAIAGRDFITGQKLSGVDQWLSLLGPLARGASMFKQT